MSRRDPQDRSLGTPLWLVIAGAVLVVAYLAYRMLAAHWAAAG